MIARSGALVAILIAASTAGVVTQSSHSHAGPPLRVGTVRFANSGSAAAQEPFLRGLALLHSYEYDDARTAFQETERADPAFALAYWCEAFTYSQFDWGTEDLPAAQAALRHLAPTREARLARAGNAGERALGAAIESFLEGNAPPIARARAFASAMRAWSASDPDNVEALAFTARAALFVLRYAPPDERVARAEDAIAIAQQVVAVAPTHPGGIHYLIHATDSPRFAERGLDAARVYDKLAPDADHALHMPSHIYLQLGMWPEVSAANERAWAASREWVERGHHSVADLGWHSLQWLQYSYLQEGRYRDALGLIDTARHILIGASTEVLTGYPDARYAVETLTFQYRLETGDWSFGAVNAGEVQEYASRSAAAPSLREQQQAASAAYHVVAALVARGDLAHAADGVAAIRSAFAALPPVNPRRAAIDASCAQLDAAIAGARGDRAAAIAALTPQAGGSREPSVAPVGPPIQQPAIELLAAQFVANRQYGDAATAYERALQERPNRSAAWLGLARAKKGAGDATGAAHAYAKLLANWARADATLPALAEAKAAVAH